MKQLVLTGPDIPSACTVTSIANSAWTISFQGGLLEVRCRPATLRVSTCRIVTISSTVRATRRHEDRVAFVYGPFFHVKDQDSWLLCSTGLLPLIRGCDGLGRRELNVNEASLMMVEAENTLGRC